MGGGNGLILAGVEEVIPQRASEAVLDTISDRIKLGQTCILVSLLKEPRALLFRNF